MKLVALDMVPIPGTSFSMGLSTDHMEQLGRESIEATEWIAKGRFDRERPEHTVTVSAFCIARAPITVGMYRPFIDGNGYHDSTWWTHEGWKWRCSAGVSTPRFWGESPWSDQELLPVVGVSWYECVAYCRWLSQQAGGRFRLPTEAEWELAARGTDHRLYPWGKRLNSAYCNTRTTHIGHTVPIGSYCPQGDSPYLIQDMVGNVSEWTSSEYRSYPYMADDGREDSRGTGERTTRGGSWHSPDLRARTTSRGMNDPWFSDHDLGFRVAVSE